jgi:CRP/FNR family transcriptional regulator
LIKSLYGHLTEVMQTQEAVAFDRVDRRLILWLLEKVNHTPGSIRCIHETIAVELGTAREVVSRLLGELKTKGAVTLGRGKVEVKNPTLLLKLSEN